MKKSLKIIVVLLIILALLIPYTVSYGTDDDTDFFEVTSDEITTSDIIEGTIIIENVPYDKFVFTLESDLDISSTEIVEEDNNNGTEITVESENEIKFEFDKSGSSLSKIILQCDLPEDIAAGDTITLVATVTNSEDEEESESIEITIKIVEKTEESKSSNETIENIESSESTESIEFNNSEDSNFDMNTNSSDFSSMSSDSRFSSDSNFDTSSMSSSSINSFSVNSSDLLTEETATYNGSDDNYLSELSITSYELNKTFSKESTTYFLTVDSSVETIEVNAVAEDDGATVCVYGNSNLSTGENKVLITVTAENGNTRTYRVYVTKN